MRGIEGGRGSEGEAEEKEGEEGQQPRYQAAWLEVRWVNCPTRRESLQLPTSFHLHVLKHGPLICARQCANARFKGDVGDSGRTYTKEPVGAALAADASRTHARHAG